jgi:hypothetical protein
MKKRIAMAAATLLVAAGFAPAVEPVAPTNRIVLFNGKDFTDWELFVPDAAHDVSTTWSVKDGVASCTGEPTGYMRTKKPYRDYKLNVEWRWAGKPGNSGVLLHVNGTDTVWPKCVETQLMDQNAGDFFVIGGVEFKEHKGVEGRRVPKKAPSNERPAGEWNQMEIMCSSSNILVAVNEVIQNQATECTADSGFICLQSEGAPIEFRRIFLDPASK